MITNPNKFLTVVFMVVSISFSGLAVDSIGAQHSIVGPEAYQR